MSGEHTPGPWKVQKSPRLQDGQHDFAIHAVKARIIAEAFGRDANGNIINAEANARLIAAAPDLLEALEELQDIILWIKADGSPALSDEIGNKLSAAMDDASDKASKILSRARGASGSEVAP